MKTETKKVQTLKVPLKTQPGALGRIYSAFKEADVNIIASWAYEMGPDSAEAVFYPSDHGKTKTVLTKLGFQPTTGWAIYVESDDKVGSYAETLAKISKANINLNATDAISTHGRYGSLFFANESDMPALCKALGC